MKSTSLIHSSIEEFYTQTSETSRLSVGLGPLEFERNKALLTRYLSAAPAIVVDVGGGPGAYAAWLSQQGHQVYLIDPVPKHIAQAQQRANRLKNPFHCLLGEAQKLNLADNMADLVILHGPLYHLQEKRARLKAIREAKRVVKPGGMVAGFAIHYAASTLAGLLNGLMHMPGFFAMCRTELLSGRHVPVRNWPGMLPQAYYHQPAELQQEFAVAGLSAIGLFAVEGMAWLDKHFFESWSKADRKKTLLELLQLTEQDASLLSFSPHIMLAARK